MTVVDTLRHQLAQYHLDRPVKADPERIREAAGATTHNLDDGECDEDGISVGRV